MQTGCVTGIGVAWVVDKAEGLSVYVWGCWNGRVSDMVGGLRALRGVLLCVRVAVRSLLCVPGTCVDVVQVALMGVVSSAVAAMDAHRGAAVVAEQGLGFLRHLSREDANRVCARCLRSMGGGQGGGLACVGEGGDGEGCVAWSASRAHDTVCCCVCVLWCDDVCPVRVWMLCRRR